MMPSVTQVLGAYADFSQVPPRRLAYAADRGSRVHAWCAAYAGGLFTPDPDQDCAGYCECFREWMSTYVYEILLTEERFTDDGFGFTGQIDLLVRFHTDNLPILVDLKTPVTKNRLWAAQLAAYKHLLEKAGYQVGRTGSLRLRPGKPALFDEYQDAPEHLAAFVSALHAWKWFAADAA